MKTINHWRCTGCHSGAIGIRPIHHYYANGAYRCCGRWELDRVEALPEPEPKPSPYVALERTRQPVLEIVGPGVNATLTASASDLRKALPELLRQAYEAGQAAASPKPTPEPVSRAWEPVYVPRPELWPPKRERNDDDDDIFFSDR